MSAWRIVQGKIPAAVRTRIGSLPIHIGSSFYVEVDGEVMEHACDACVPQFTPLAGAKRLGAASAALIAAGQAVVGYFEANACTQDAVDEVTTFQETWNGEHSGSQLLTVDGQYGPLTQGALQTALGTTTVPANCFGGPAQPPAPLPTPPVPGPPGPPGTPGTSSSSGTGPLPYIIASGLVVAALGAYTYSRKKKH